VDKGAPLLFSYSGNTGPNRWADLSPNFTLCSSGKAQSPIDIDTGKVVPDEKLKALIRDYRAVNVTLVDYKFTVGIEYPDGTGSIFVYGKEYKLRQMHFHSPSEHRIDGKRYAAELHMVHVADDGELTVVGTLFEYGRPDPVLDQIYGKLYQLADSGGIRIPIGAFHPPELRKTPAKYYRYVGSSSVPPCGENVPYVILGKVRSVSPEQVAAIKAPLEFTCKDNARPTQPINGRHVHAY
ncbi:hypothetical protein M569_01041, partial [Genlisea aurea]